MVSRTTFSILSVFLWVATVFAGKQTSELLALATFHDALNVEADALTVVWSPAGYVSALGVDCDEGAASGELPDPLGFARLEIFILSRCGSLVKGSIGALQGLNHLRQLKISDADLKGSLDLSSLNGTRLADLTIVDCPGISVDLGLLPSTLPALMWLQFSSITVSGRFPVPLNAPKLQNLQLKMIMVDGPMPEVPLSSDIERYELERSSFTGSLAPLCSLSNNRKRMRLKLVALSVSGEIPSCVQNISMYQLHLQQIDILGEVEEWLFEGNVTEIYLRSIGAPGAVPVDICEKMPTLELLSIRYCFLKFNASAVRFENCHQLLHLELENSNAFGSFPLLVLPKLTGFIVTSTNVTGFLPVMNPHATEIGLVGTKGMTGVLPTALFSSSSSPMTQLALPCSVPPNNVSFSENLTLDQIVSKSIYWFDLTLLGCSQVSGTLTAARVTANFLSLKYFRLDGVDLLGHLPVEVFRSPSLLQLVATNCNISVITPFSDNLIVSGHLEVINLLGNPLSCPAPANLWCLEPRLEPNGLSFPPCGEMPTILSISASGSSITLEWSPLSPNSPDGGVLIGYRVFRSLETKLGSLSCESSVNITVDDASTSATFTGLSVNLHYTIRLVGMYKWAKRTGDGITWFSENREVAEAEITTSTGIPSASPTSVRIGKLSANSVELLWSPIPQSELDGVSVAYYFVRAVTSLNDSIEIGSCSAAGSNGSRCTVTGLSPSQSVSLSVVGTLELHRFDSLMEDWEIELAETGTSINVTVKTCSAEERGAGGACYPCLGPHGCNGSSECVYPHTGPLCSGCVDGYYFAPTSFECKECPAFPILPVLVLPFMVAAGYWIVRLKKRAIVAGMLFTAFINTSQLAGICLRIVMQLPGMLTLLGQGGGYFNLDLGNLHLDCYTSVSFYTEYFVSVALPLFAALLVLGYDRLLNRKFRRGIALLRDDLAKRRLEKEFFDKRANGRRIVLLLATLYYVRFISKLVDPLVCIDSSAGRTLVADDSEACNSTVNWVAQLLSILLLILAVALPIIVGVVIRRGLTKGKLDSPSFFSTFGALYSQYRSKHCHFESIVLLRKAVCVNLAFILLMKTEYQLWLSFLASVLYFVVLLVCKPFRRCQRHWFGFTVDVVNAIEVGGAVLLSLLSGTILVMYYSHDPLGFFSLLLAAALVFFFSLWIGVIFIIVIRELRRGFDDANLQIQGEELLLEVDRLAADVHRAISCEKYSIAIELKSQLDFLRIKGLEEARYLNNKKISSGLVVPVQATPLSRLRVGCMAAIRAQLAELMAQPIPDKDEISSVLWKGWTDLCGLLTRAIKVEDVHEVRAVARLLKQYESLCCEDVFRFVLSRLEVAKRDVLGKLFNPENGWSAAENAMLHLIQLSAQLHSSVASLKSSLHLLQSGVVVGADEPLLGRISRTKGAFVLSSRLHSLERLVSQQVIRGWCCQVLRESIGYLRSAVQSEPQMANSVEMRLLSAEALGNRLPEELGKEFRALETLSKANDGVVNPLCGAEGSISAFLVRKYRSVATAAQKRTLAIVKWKRRGMWTAVCLVAAAATAAAAILLFPSGGAAATAPIAPASTANKSETTGMCQLITPSFPTCSFGQNFWGSGGNNMTVGEASTVLNEISTNLLRFILSAKDADEKRCLDLVTDFLCSLYIVQCNGTCSPVAGTCQSVCDHYFYKSGCAAFILVAEWRQIKPGGVYYAYFKSRFPDPFIRDNILWGLTSMSSCAAPAWEPDAKKQCSNSLPNVFPDCESEVELGNGLCEQPKNGTL